MEDLIQILFIIIIIIIILYYLIFTSIIIAKFYAPQSNASESNAHPNKIIGGPHLSYTPPTLLFIYLFF